MGLLKSVDNVPGIDFYEYRDNIYYNKYEFRMRVEIPHLRYVYWCKTTDDLDKKILGKYGRYGNVKSADLSEVITHQEALKIIINLQNDRKKSKDLGLRVEGTTVAFFSNELNKLQDIAIKFDQLYSFDYTQVQTSQYAGIKHFVSEPKHKYRVYLKSKRVEDGFVKEFSGMLSRMKNLYPSNALATWINQSHKPRLWSYNWTSASHYIDYDDESTLSYLALMHGEILGKKYKLEKRPEET